MRRPRGAALLLALWLLLLTAGLVTVFAFAARIEALQGSVLRSSAAARYAAEAGIELASVRVQTPAPEQRWVPDGRTYGFPFEGHEVSVRIHDEAGKFDLNVAQGPALARLFEVLGVEAGAASRLGGAIADWRDADDLQSVDGAEDRDYEAARLPYGARDQPFVSVSELQQVLGMDPDLYARVAPFLTVYTGGAQPEPAYAEAEVLRAMGLDPLVIARILEARATWRPGMPPPVLPDGSTLAAAGTGTYSISSRATRPDGTTVEVTATVRAGAGGLFGQLYTPLAWRVGDPD